MDILSLVIGFVLGAVIALGAYILVRRSILKGKRDEILEKAELEGQKISIKIAGRMFNLTATSPEAEELYRNAADIINQRYADYTRNHPGKNVSDLLSMIALNETVLRLQQKKEIDGLKEDEKLLARDLERYLQDFGTK